MNPITQNNQFSVSQSGRSTRVFFAGSREQALEKYAKTEGFPSYDALLKEWGDVEPVYVSHLEFDEWMIYLPNGEVVQVDIHDFGYRTSDNMIVAEITFQDGNTEMVSVLDLSLT